MKLKPLPEKLKESVYWNGSVTDANGIDTNVVKEYSSGKKLYELEGQIVKEWSSGKKLLEFDGQTVKEWSSGKKLLEFDGRTVKEWSSGKKLYEASGIVPRIFLALVALGVI